MMRALTIGHVNLTLRTDLTENAELSMRAAAAGIDFHGMRAIVLRRVTAECRIITARAAAECQVVADGVLADMACWAPEQWQQARHDFA